MITKRTILHLSIFSLVMALSACDVDVKEEGKLPSVDVDADAGNLPEYEVVKTKDGKMPSMDVDAKSGKLPKVDVDTVDINVGTKTKTVKVPDVDVDMEEKEVTVPDIDLEMPKD